ncbi:MAG: phospho-N-acetylmuramoyl-pentapeptide-transferase [Caldilinea sp.]|nr:phospho-N-acetylmuramoyl-pentapeptide-transferase [Caldilinea sp.]MCB0056110.1 phospho-N-acetylmuramoyl-pentapeptide-transferase [Caldilineaceae bacterium]MCB0040524.1 phospho-N-acetylmuramoyl-pentapeptide-transferase [Caldilinea sp.]MCB9114212.1 phospho-N-acetylmuramoyl-pentapeptide-transferase [Caldilineaceae bacterium]MCB9120838.1 phospho-N-acetylmuramoyl-pentapeptide-transferase [Caldilineaceae bacterium]
MDNPLEPGMAYALALGAVSFFFAAVWGRPLIGFLRRKGIGKQIRIDQPGSHQFKTGTPTMGGMLFVVPVLVITGMLNFVDLLGMNAIGQSTLLLFFCLGSHALLGAVDDWQGIKGIRGKGEGMSPRMKSSFQVIFASIIAAILYFGPPQWDYVGVPGFKDFFRIGPLILPVTVFLLVWCSNAVNLTDGLDSLAGSTSLISFACYGTIAYMQDQVYLAIFCFTLAGALLGFLWYNAYPAQLFMGDTGSLALGATLALVSIMTGQWLLLPMIGLVFAAETISVMLQVGYFKLTRRMYGEGRRLFKMSPLHHHFELLGWSEMQVKERFFIASVLAGMLGVALALI